MKTIETSCAICGAKDDYEVIFQDNFREFDFNPDIFSARRMPDRIHYRIVRCKNDNLIRSNPIVGQDTIAGLYKKSKFTYEEETQNLTATYLNALKAVLPSLSRTARILEVGCGNGFVLKALSEMGYKNVCGVEPSIDAVKKADYGIREKITADILKPGIFQSETFDFIFFFQTLDHIQDPNAFLKICYELLVPGGFILSLNHDVDGIFVKLLKSRHPIIDVEHTYLYGRQTIRKIFEKNNFYPVRIYYPQDIVSLRHLLWFSPLPVAVKKRMLNIKNAIYCGLLKNKIKIKFGNLCIIAKKQR